MKQLIETVETIANKYMEQADLKVLEDILTLEYYIYKNNKKYHYKTLQIEEIENQFKVTILPDEIIKITDLKGLEDIILILDKQSKTKDHTQEEIKHIKEKYIEGTKIELIKMYDIQAPLPKTRGFIESVDDKGTLHIRWQNGSSLGLIVGVDEFKIICPLCNQELEKEND